MLQQNSVLKSNLPMSLFNYPQLTKYLQSLCPVIGGRFRIGSNKSVFLDSYPATWVTVDDFYIAKYPVTNALWNEYLKDAGLTHELKSRRIAAPDLPITQVSWNEIVGTEEGDGFCTWVQRITGQPFTLPSEAEFEYVASNFGNPSRFPWGDTWDATKLWASDGTVRRDEPASVYRKRNLYTTKSGAVDMTGNVWQWCRDWYRPYGRPAVPSPSANLYVVKAVRGGPYALNNVGLFETSARYSASADEDSRLIGFRLVVPASILAQRVTEVQTRLDRPRIWPSALLSSTGQADVTIPSPRADATYALVQPGGRNEQFDGNNQITCHVNPGNNIVEIVATLASGTRTSRVYFITSGEKLNVAPRYWTTKSVITDLARLPYLRRYIDELRLIQGGDRPNGKAAAAFRIGATPVTEGLWYEYLFAMNPTGPRRLSKTPDLPIVGISWTDVMGSKFRPGFVQWVSRVTGLEFTLPSITEVELALVGESSESTPWHNSRDPEADDQFLWTSLLTKRNGPGSVYRSDHIISSQSGVTDILGNVRQWLKTTKVDNYGRLLASYYGFGFGTGNNGLFVLGGDDKNFVTMRSEDLGFRLVLHTLDTGSAPLETGVVLDCSPYSPKATITIDGAERRSRTVLTVKRSREFDVSVTLKGFQTYRAVVQVPKGEVLTHSVKLVPYRKRPLSEFPRLQEYLQSLCAIPAGTFEMGSTSHGENERPVHKVTLSAFRLGAHPVTFSIWKEYCDATGTLLPKAPEWGFLEDHPVVNVSWNDIMGSDGKSGFCAWASDVAGYRLKLPTESQFEYATCGGQSGLKYPWGNIYDRSKLWSPRETITSTDRTAPVIRNTNIFRNIYGLTDLVGNVEQWCLDWYGPYGNASQNDPLGPSSSYFNQRCVRGGSWKNKYQDGFRCAYRRQSQPDDRYGDEMSFRLAAGPG